MHVLHLETGRHLYGGARQVIELAAGLPALGCASSLACGAASEVEQAAYARGIDVRPLRAGGDLDVRLLPRLKKICSAVEPDLVHIHSRRGADTWGLLAARSAGYPVVLSRRVDNPDLPGLSRLRYGLCQRVIAISAGIEAVLRGTGVPASKLRRVVSAVDLESCQPTWTKARFREEFFLAADDLVVGVVAQMIPRKGHQHLVSLVQTLRHVVPNVRLILFGRGEFEAQLRGQVAKNGLDKFISFAGYRSDLMEFIGHLDLLLHPARSEGLGLALLEAQAAGVPVVAFRIAGVREAVVDGESGLLVPPGDVPALIDATQRLLLQSDLRSELSAGARAHVGQNFSLQAMLAGNLAVYQDLLEEIHRGAQ